MKKIHKKRNSIRYNYYKKYKDIKEIIEKRYNILIGIITIIIFILFISLFNIQIIKHDYYVANLEKLSRKIIEGNTAPRGRIYDRNHKLIVDNKPTKVIYYKKEKGNNISKEIEIAYNLAEMIELDFNKLTDKNLRNFWLKKNSNEANKLIKAEEWKKLEERKLTSSDIEKLKLERITEEELNKYEVIDKEAAYIYTLMNKGYSYSEKVIKKDNVTDEEYAIVASSVDKLKGIATRLDWDRSYLYNDVFRSILGSISTNESGIPADLKEHYKNKGYSLDDRVGISYLEYQYDDYLKGTKNKYEILANNDKVLIEEGNRGNDLVLSIDIELQKQIEEIIVDELLRAKEEPNTEYYNRSFVIVTDPKTGEVLAMAGKQIVKKNDGYEIFDYAPGITTAPVVVGSVVKGASHIVGYNTGALSIGEKRNDACIKLKSAPIKCSWKYLGNVDDITALKLSSNTYQFHTAMKVAKQNYIYDGPFKADHNAYKIYRDTFAEFGLGVKTGIDLPVESLGFKGKSEIGGLLLDFAIGQYDTYTPIQLSQYIGTIANNGNRIQPSLLRDVYDSKYNDFTKKIYTTKSKKLNSVNTKQEYLDRIKTGFIEVLKYGGTGSGYVDLKHEPAGKTGTSQSFIDTDNDGKIDKETVTTTFVAYAPATNPKVTFTVISPDIYHYDNNSTFQSMVNKRISKRVSDKYFEIYP